MRIFPTDTPDTEFKTLGDLGYDGSINDRQFKYLEDIGFPDDLTHKLDRVEETGLSEITGVVSWFDASRLKYTFQDTAGTTQADTEGDPVRRLESSLGNAFASEATDYPTLGESSVDLNLDTKHLRMVRQSQQHETLGYTVLPTSTIRPNNPTGSEEVSFTNTGLSRHTDGRWIVSQFGKGVVADSVNSSIVILDSSDKSVLLAEYDLSAEFGTDFTLQGNAWDSAREVIWLCDTTNDIVRSIDIDGNSTASSIDIGTELGADASISAIAYDADRDLLLVGNQTSGGVNQVREYDPDTGLVSRVFTVKDALDQITVFEGYLYAANGTNGINGDIKQIRLSDGLDIAIWTNIENADCIEGLVCTGRTPDGYLKFSINHDGGFHNAAGDGAEPPLGTITDAKLKAYGYLAPDELPSMTLILVAEFDSFPGSSNDQVLGWNDPQSLEAGWALQIQSTGGLRFLCLNEGDAGAAARRQAWSLPSITDGQPHVFVLDHDGTNAPDLYVDGVLASATTDNDFSTYTEGLNVGNLAIGGAYSSTGSWVSSSDSDFRLHELYVGEQVSEEQRLNLQSFIADRNNITLS